MSCVQRQRKRSWRSLLPMRRHRRGVRQSVSRRVRERRLSVYADEAEDAMSDLRFKGEKAQAQARRYVYGKLAEVLEHEIIDLYGGDFSLGLEHEADRRRVMLAIRKVHMEMTLRAQG